jgi:hypothetical protein
MGAKSSKSSNSNNRPTSTGHQRHGINYYADWNDEEPCACGTKHLQSTTVEWRTCLSLHPIEDAAASAAILSAEFTAALAQVLLLGAILPFTAIITVPLYSSMMVVVPLTEKGRNIVTHEYIEVRT